MVYKVKTVFTNLLDVEGKRFWSETKILINIRKAQLKADYTWYYHILNPK